MAYASKTSVPVSRSRQVLEDMLTKAGARGSNAAALLTEGRGL